jgi:hypothetical protein
LKTPPEGQTLHCSHHLHRLLNSPIHTSRIRQPHLPQLHAKTTLSKTVRACILSHPPRLHPLYPLYPPAHHTPIRYAFRATPTRSATRPSKYAEPTSGSHDTTGGAPAAVTTTSTSSTRRACTCSRWEWRAACWKGSVASPRTRHGSRPCSTPAP